MDDEISCRVILKHDSLLQPSGLDTDVCQVGTTIEAKYSDVGEPEKGHTFLIEGDLYTVQRIESNDRIMVKMWVTENES